MKVLCSVGLGVGMTLVACSGRYDVGFEPVSGGSAGTTSNNNDNNSSSDSNAAGSKPQGMAGSVSAGGSGSAGASVGVGGATEPAPMLRCNYSPLGNAAVPTDVASSAELAARVYRFLDASEAPSDVQLPRTPSAAWAAKLATAILDAHAAANTEAPGLVRFLSSWLPQPQEPSPMLAAHTWGKKLVAANATLGTLLSEPTGKPHRFGILTEPDVLTVRTRITTRGTWMMKSVFCREVPAPPIGIAALDPQPPAGMTYREQLQADMVNPSCQSCHVLTDPPGDSLEHFDAAGNYRELDNGQPVDASATMSNPSFTFNDFDSLAPQLATSCDAAQCLGTSLFKDALAAGLAQANVTIDDSEGNQVASQFAEADFSIRALVKAIVTSPSFVR